jgi:hypothetical protein
MTRPPPDPFQDVPEDDPEPPEEGVGTPWFDDDLANGAPDPVLPAEDAGDSAGTDWDLSSWPDPGDPEPVHDEDGTDRLDDGSPRHDMYWATPCIEIATGRAWRAYLDPTRETSVVFGKEQAEPMLFWLGSLTIKITHAQPDPDPRVVFGRDALGGRVRILV